MTKRSKASVSLNWLLPRSLSGKLLKSGSLSRSPYLTDYGAVIHSSKFRRLSFKTQVQLSPTRDFARTRLTHSIEVSQLGRQLARFLGTLVDARSERRYLRLAKRPHSLDLEDLVATACLAHDIGQAPFGHKGEKVINTLAGGYGSKFDANKQNVRIMLGAGVASEPVAITAQLLDAVMKYKDDRIFGSKAPAYFATELLSAETLIFDVTLTGNRRHPATYLMEAADDIAYIAGDVEDFIKLNPAELNSLLPLLNKLPIVSKDYTQSVQTSWEQLLERCKSGDPTSVSHKLIKCLVVHVCKGISKACSGLALEDLPDAFSEFFSTKSHKKELQNLVYWKDSTGLGDALADTKARIYKEMILNEDIRSKEQLAERVLIELWHAFAPVFLRSTQPTQELLREVPPEVLSRLKDLPFNAPYTEDNERVRMLCDFISGMTDRYALDLWERLCSPQKIRKTS